MLTGSAKTRLRFDHTETDTKSDGQCHVQVTLALGQLLFQADAADTADANGPLIAAAAATLKALQEAAANKFTCSLSDLDHVNALGKDLIAVLVDVTFQGRVNQVFGSCQIAGSEIDCAVKAALNATNRMFELAMRGE